jgi:flagellin-like hook-associated protein FlgL
MLDIVTADNDDDSVSVIIGNGDGTFRARTTVAVGSVPIAVALGDLNGDGILDIVVANSDDGNASILLGNGNGTFKPRTDVVTGANPNSAKLGDLNGDGVLDLITADASDNTASILLGNGDGTFRVRSTVQTGNSPLSVTLGDLNGDGVLDVVSTDANNGIYLAQTVSGLSPILPFSLLTKADALQSLGMLERTANNLAKQRGVIGANQSRVATALSTLESARENFQVAAARIQDADIASDTAALTRIQIVQQSAASILAQANLPPELALQLLTQ